MKTARSLSTSKSFTPFILLCVGLVLVVGCKSIGPKTIPRDRYDYSSSIGESWKRQTLLNIVKLRYLDPPIFVDVGQIVAGYSLETSGNAGGQISEAGAVPGNSLYLGASTKFIDRPTVTYVPMTGDRFVRALMTPLTPESVFFTIESGWPAEAILFTAVTRLNGLKNQEASITGLSKADPRFLRALELFGQIQAAGVVGMRIEQDAQKQQTTLMTIRSAAASEETLAKGRELRELLGLSPGATEFKLVFGALAANDRELAMQTRSLLHILSLLAAQVEVPPEHVTQGRAAPGAVEAEQQGAPTVRLARIRCSKKNPADAYVAVQYRGYWFWIDDRDLKSKRTFAFMMMLFTLADTGEKQGLPLITIPAQ
jgi:hypothetical protein